MDLGCRIVLCLRFWRDDRISLICIDQIVCIIADDTRRASVNQGLNSRLLTRFNDTFGSLDVDLVVQGLVADTNSNDSRRRSVDHDIRPYFLEDRQDRG